jgi:hypothetical protein
MANATGDTAAVRSLMFGVSSPVRRAAARAHTSGFSHHRHIQLGKKHQVGKTKSICSPPLLTSLPLRTAMASTACLPRAFLPARTRSATSSSPRHASLKCSAYNTKTGFGSHSVPVAPTTPPRGAVADDVEFVDLNRLRPPPAPLPGPTVRDPRWLPRTTTALVDSGFD